MKKKRRKKSTKQPNKINFGELLIGGLIDLIVAVTAAYIISKLP